MSLQQCLLILNEWNNEASIIIFYYISQSICMRWIHYEWHILLIIWFAMIFQCLHQRHEFGCEAAFSYSGTKERCAFPYTKKLFKILKTFCHTQASGVSIVRINFAARAVNKTPRHQRELCASGSALCCNKVEAKLLHAHNFVRKSEIHNWNHWSGDTGCSDCLKQSRTLKSNVGRFNRQTCACAWCLGRKVGHTICRISKLRAAFDILS